MPKFACVGLLALIATSAFAQNRDPRVDELTKQTAELKRHIADQDEKIAELEKAVKALQTATAPPVPARIPNETPAWYRASSWTQIKTGMSEAEVTSILGPPTSVDSS